MIIRRVSLTCHVVKAQGFLTRSSCIAHEGLGHADAVKQTPWLLHSSLGQHWLSWSWEAAAVLQVTSAAALGLTGLMAFHHTYQ